MHHSVLLLALLHSTPALSLHHNHQNLHSTSLNKHVQEQDSNQVGQSQIAAKEESARLEAIIESILQRDSISPSPEPISKRKRATARVVPNPKNPSSSTLVTRTSSTISTSPSSIKTTSAAVISSTAIASRSTSSTTRSSSSSSSIPSSSTKVFPPPPADCATPQYSNAAVIFGPQSANGIPMNPSPSTFVKKNSDGTLSLDGKLFKILGPNIYWLGLDENVGIAYPTQGRIREAFAISVAMGANTVRSITLGVSIGNPLSLWPSAGTTNGAAFASIDYSIAAAKAYGIRLIIPLTDNYQYYHGGKFDFLRFAGKSTSDGSLFYTDATTIALYKQYISFLLNHVNVYTGVALKNEPTILAFETGNELGSYMLSDAGGPPPAAWTLDITSFIKSLAPQTLVADGTNGLTNSNGVTTTNAFKVEPIDLVTDHFYPAASYLLQKDAGIVSGASMKKNYYVGELDWTGLRGGDTLQSFYSLLESVNGAGSMIWSVFGHDDKCCSYVQHNDGYSLYYPNGNPSSLNPQILLLVQHWYRMRGLTPPNSLPAVACPQTGLP